MQCTITWDGSVRTLLCNCCSNDVVKSMPEDYYSFPSLYCPNSTSKVISAVSASRYCGKQSWVQASKILLSSKGLPITGHYPRLGELSGCFNNEILSSTVIPWSCTAAIEWIQSLQRQIRYDSWKKMKQAPNIWWGCLFADLFSTNCMNSNLDLCFRNSKLDL